MKKWKILLMGIFLLLLIGNTFGFKSLSEAATKSFEKLFEKSFFREVFDLDKEEAVAVFGNEENGAFV